MNKQASGRAGLTGFALRFLKLVILLLLHIGPAGAAGWLLKSVSRKPLRWLLALVLEPLLSYGSARLARRLTKEKNETTAR